MAIVESEAREAMDDNIHALVPAREQSPIALGALRASTASEMIDIAREQATVLADVIQQQKLFKRIGKKDYVFVEGWTTLATMMGCLPSEVSVEYDAESGAYTAVAELRRMADQVTLVRASAECGHDDDSPWNKRAHNARRSMAITRATSKACRLAFSWVMTLAGYAPTPAEEMPSHEAQTAGPALVLSAQETVVIWESRLLACENMAALQSMWPQAQCAAKATGDKSVLAELAGAKDQRKTQLANVIEGESSEVAP